MYKYPDVSDHKEDFNCDKVGVEFNKAKDQAEERTRISKEI